MDLGIGGSLRECLGVLTWRGFGWVLTLVVECPHLERIDLAHSLRLGWHSHPIPTWRGLSSSTPECRATRTTWRSGPHGGPQTVPGLGALGAPSPLWDLKWGDRQGRRPSPLGTMEDSSHPTLFPVVGSGLQREDRGKGVAPDQ
uniref:Uncharacterized protein n=1 Tax=Ananas comosus var. bracteatus TaxID=296719 RepID=A0A6V7PVK0_ANACO|nr:unnamed protein product [Ananas comosus var. bracteatus]